MGAENPAYNDKWIRITAVPLFTAIGYYITYNQISLNQEFLVLYLSDLLKGFIVWEILRRCVILLDRRLPWQGNVLKRLILQLSFPVATSLLVFIIMVQFEYRFIRSFPLENFFTLDVWIVLVFLLCGTLTYTALYFYQQYAELENRPAPARETNVGNMLVKFGNREIKVEFQDVIAFYSEGKQTWLLTKEQKRLPVDQSLDKLEQVVPEYFFRANRQYLIVPAMVKSMSPDTYGKVRIETEDVYHLPPIIISREKAASFKKWFREHTSSA